MVHSRGFRFRFFHAANQLIGRRRHRVAAGKSVVWSTFLQLVVEHDGIVKFGMFNAIRVCYACSLAGVESECLRQMCFVH